MSPLSLSLSKSFLAATVGVAVVSESSLSSCSAIKLNKSSFKSKLPRLSFLPGVNFFGRALRSISGRLKSAKSESARDTDAGGDSELDRTKSQSELWKLGLTKLAKYIDTVHVPGAPQVKRLQDLFDQAQHCLKELSSNIRIQATLSPNTSFSPNNSIDFPLYCILYTLELAIS